MDTRVCKVCGIAKPFDGINYHIKYGVPVGRVCRACLNLAQNVRRTDHAVRLATNLCSKLYWANNKKKRAEKNNAWKKKNRAKATMWNATRRAKQLNATPKWLDTEQLRQIGNFYGLAKLLTEATGIKHHVDHIVPLQGKQVSGLHVPWNLQVLPAAENISKGNRHANL